MGSGDEVNKEITYSCYLCMEHQYCKDKVPRFMGYCLRSGEPWHSTAIGSREFQTVLYATKSKRSYQDAQDAMSHAVKYLAENIKGSFWKEVWSWVQEETDDAHITRYEMKKEAGVRCAKEEELSNV